MKSYVKTNQKVMEMYQEYQRAKYQREARDKELMGRLGFKLTLPTESRIQPEHRLKGFNSSYLQLHGRPKKLSKWGYKAENDIPGKVKVIL